MGAPAIVWVPHPTQRCKLAYGAELPAIWAWLLSFVAYVILRGRIVAGLVAQTCEALVAAEHCEHVKDRW